MRGTCVAIDSFQSLGGYIDQHGEWVGEGCAPSSPQEGGLEEHCKFPQWDLELGVGGGPYPVYGPWHVEC